MSVAWFVKAVKTLGPREMLRQLYHYDYIKMGTLVGVDKLGNKYYKNLEEQHGRHRWVEYNTDNDPHREPTRIQPEWHGWMTHMTDNTPMTDDTPVTGNTPMTGDTPIMAWAILVGLAALGYLWYRSNNPGQKRQATDPEAMRAARLSRLGSPQLATCSDSPSRVIADEHVEMPQPSKVTQ